MAHVFRRSPLVLFLPVLAIFAIPSFGQTPPPTPPEVQPPAVSEGDQKQPPLLEEIEVTAEKRTENVKDVPEAVTAISDEAVDLLTTGGGDVKALSGRVPSLLIESSFGRSFPRFYIRGLGNTDFDLNASQPVSMVYDDVVLENPVVKGMPVWDVEQVEVLRGPQGTLFGRNTPAGIIKFDSKKPSQKFEAYATGSYGTYGTTDIKGAVGGPFSKTLSGRFSFLYQGQNDWVDNGFTGKNNALGGYSNDAFRGQLLWEPSVRFHGLLNLHGWNVDGTARIFRANILKVGSNDLVDGFKQSEVFQDGKNKQTIHSKGGVAKVDYDFDRAILTSVTGYESLDMFSRGDIDGGFGAVFAPPFGPGFIPFPSESSDGIPRLHQFTEEVRYASNTEGPLQWLAGLFYFDEGLRAETRSYTSLAPGNPQEGLAFQKQDTRSSAIFGSVDYKITPRWKVKGGLRFSQDKKDFAAERPQPLFFNTATIAPVTAKTDENNTSWDASATYALNPDMNLYGRVATGFRPPSIQGRILFAPDTEGGSNPATNGVSVAGTEEILSAETGFKSELMAHRLRVNSTVYKYRVKGQQMTAVGGQYNVATILNADKTEGYGFESDINFAPARPWLVTIGTSYNHTEIRDKNLSVAPCGGGCTVLDPIGPNGALVNGNSLPHAPKWIFNAIVDYRMPVHSGMFVGSLDAAYSSRKQFFLYESKEFNSDSFELGLRLGYMFSRYELALYGRNITNEVVVQNGIDFNNLTGMTNDPKVVGLELSARF
jgi:iron complex outermembrane receptor protein